jgi:hypothetical protein
MGSSLAGGGISAGPRLIPAGLRQRLLQSLFQRQQSELVNNRALAEARLLPQDLGAGPGFAGSPAPPAPEGSRADPGMARAGFNIGSTNIGGNLGVDQSRGIIGDAVRGFFSNTLGLGQMGPVGRFGARLGEFGVGALLGKAPFPTSLVVGGINTLTGNIANQATARARNEAMMDAAKPFGELPFGMPDPGPPMGQDPYGVPPDPESLTGRTFGNALFSNPESPYGYSYGITNTTNFGTRGDDPDAPVGPPADEGNTGSVTGGYGDPPGDSPDFATGGTVLDRMKLPRGLERISAHENEEIIRPEAAQAYRPLLKAINRGESPLGLVKMLISGAAMTGGGRRGI